MTTLTLHDLGRASYADALALQERLLTEVQAGPEDRGHLVLVEHDPPVITFGRGARAEHLLASRERLATLGIETAETARGGDVTYHGPGQLVGYPIMHLPPGKRPVRTYVHDLEEALIRLCARFGVAARREQGLTGVWAGDAKIAAIGIAVSHWVAWHGFALNVGTDLAHFDLIVPCGLSRARVTSISEVLGRPVAVEEVKGPLTMCLAEVFGFAIE